MMMNIEFSIGPSNQEQHDFVLQWLNDNKYTIQSISYNGDHFSEIHCTGDYNKAYRKVSSLKHLSIENW